MRAIRLLAPALAFLALPAAPVNAGDSVSPFVRMSVSPGLTRDAFLARTRSVFARLDADGDGVLDAADALAYGRGQAAADRAANVARLLAFDLDGNGRIELGELAAGLRRGLPLPEVIAAVDGVDVPGASAAALASLDRNADGRVDLAEMLALPVAESHVNPVAAFLDAFRTPDGRLGEAAFVQGMLAEAFDAADTDGDGVISREEAGALVGLPAR